MRAMNDDAVLARIAELSLELPPPPEALAAYVPARRVGDAVFVSGQVPMIDGQLLHPGHLGDDVTVEEGAAAARQAALQSLSALRGSIRTFDVLNRIAQVTVYVAATPTFTAHPQVANGASELFVAILGPRGEHARAAVGVASLPLGACVEVAITANLV
jgi:enamine deaminase RidA (YjgF/YER057c/UK114 family)